MRGRDDKKYETTLPRNTDTFSVSHYPLEVFLRLLLLHLFLFIPCSYQKKEYIYILLEGDGRPSNLKPQLWLKKNERKKKSPRFVFLLFTSLQDPALHEGSFPSLVLTLDNILVGQSPTSPACVIKDRYIHRHNTN